MADDRRIRRTKKALRNSLMMLLKEKPMSKITIRELTELADMNRGTFYLHYTDIFDLYCNIKDDFLNELLIAVQPPTDTLYRYYLNLFRFLEENTEILFLLNQDASFIEQIIDVLKKQHLENWIQRFSNSNRMYYEYFYHFATEGSIGIIKRWCQEKTRESPEVMAQMMAVFAESGFTLLQTNKGT